jgi:pantoate--beta-alanine ligase
MAEIAVFETVAAMRTAVAGWHAAGDKVALVPTMGALHQGHIALVKEAQRHAKRVITSIFVNPTQFAPHEDFKKYPRTFDNDCAMLAEAGGRRRLLPPGRGDVSGRIRDARSCCSAPPLSASTIASARLISKAWQRFAAKLFTQSQADCAVFGEKDYQQLKVVTRMAADLDLGIEIVPLPTFREPDGLAMSSRNRYLSAEHRALAPLLHEVMQALATRLRNRDDLFKAVTGTRKARSSRPASSSTISRPAMRTRWHP